jgi:hypothetical protein
MWMSRLMGIYIKLRPDHLFNVSVKPETGGGGGREPVLIEPSGLCIQFPIFLGLFKGS